MIITRNIKQGSADWFNLRVGVVTASNLDRIITPAKLLPSAAADGYMDEMLAELAYGHSLDSYQSDAMETGNLNEGESLDNYCFQNNCEIEKIAFVTNDEGTVGCSPDAIVVKDGAWLRGVEAKNPKPATHSGYMRDNQLLIKKYWCQVQWCLHVCGLDKWDLFSYDAKQHFVQVEIGRDEKFIAAAKTYVDQFLERFAKEKQRRGLPDRISIPKPTPT